MNSLSLTEKFKDQSNYLVAFLASVIGLGAFKDSLSAVHITLFNSQPSIFNLAVPLMVLLLVSTYLSALTMLVDSLNVTAFPLKGYILFLASLTGALALVAPIFFVFFWGVSILQHFLSPPTVLKSIVATLTGVLSGVVVGSVTVFASYVITRNNQSRFQELSALKAVNRPRTDMAESAQGGHEFEFLKNYEDLSNYIKEYLEVIGYGVRNVSLHHMAKILADKHVLTEDDLKKTRTLSTLRNEYVHGSTNVTPARILKGFKSIDELEEKISQAYWVLISGDGEAASKFTKV